MPPSIPAQSPPTDPELRWRHAGRALLAKTIAELAYEDLLHPVPQDDGWHTLTLEGSGGPEIEYRFLADRGAYGSWFVDPGSVRRNDRLHVTTVGVQRRHRDDIGEQRAGGVELVAVEPQHPCGVGKHLGVRARRRPAASIRDGIADDDAGVYTWKPNFAFFRCGPVAEQAFGKSEV